MMQICAGPQEYPRADALTWLFAGALAEEFRGLCLSVQWDAVRTLEALSEYSTRVLRPALIHELRAIYEDAERQATEKTKKIEGQLRKAVRVRLSAGGLRSINTNPVLIDESRWFLLKGREGLLLTISPGRQVNLPKGGEMTVNKEYQIHRNEVLEATDKP